MKRHRESYVVGDFSHVTFEKDMHIIISMIVYTCQKPHVFWIVWGHYVTEIIDEDV